MRLINKTLSVLPGVVCLDYKLQVGLSTVHLNMFKRSHILHRARKKESDPLWAIDREALKTCAGHAGHHHLISRGIGVNLE